MMTNWGYHHAYPISSWLHTMIDYISFLATWAILDPFSGSQSTFDTPRCGFPKSFHFLVFKFLFWSLWSHLSSTEFHLYSVSCYLFAPTSYFWCVISRFRSRGGRMITSLNFIAWGIWFPILHHISLHHISGVSSFDFAPEGAGWLHHWTTFQLNLNLIAWSIWLPFLMSLSLGASHHLGHHVPLFLTSLSSAHHLSTSIIIKVSRCSIWIP